MCFRTSICALAFSLLPLATSCIESIDYGKAHGTKLVVNCILVPEEEQTLRISFNGEIGSYRFDTPENAEARLFCNGNEIGKFSKLENDPYWKLMHQPIPGGKYCIKVSVPGYDEITAETTFPNSTPPVERTSSVSPRIFIQTGESTPFWIFAVRQPVEEWDILMRYPSATEKDRLSQEIGTDHPGVDGFNVQTLPVRISDNVEGKTISQYIYLRVVPAEVQYPLQFSLEWQNMTGSLVYFRSVSDEYDKYLKTSLQKILAVQDEDDPTYWFDDKKVYCNINGGLGIFGAYRDYIIQINDETDRLFNKGIPYDDWPFDM